MFSSNNPARRLSLLRSEIVEEHYVRHFGYKYPVVVPPRFLSPSAILVVFHPN